MTALDKVKKLVLDMVQSIVDHPDDVEIHTQDSDFKGEIVTQMNIKVAESDIRIAIGTGGATAEAVRRIASMAAKNLGHEQQLSIRVDAPRLPSNHFYKGNKE